MTTTPTIEFGVVRFIPIETFSDPTCGLDKEARVEKMTEKYTDTPPKPQSVGDWPRVHTAIRRLGIFVVETSTPSFTATLRFSPEQPETGDYEIRHRPRGATEKGRTIKVTAVPADETDSGVSMLAPFATRYAVVTVGAERPHVRMVWLVGLRDFRSFNTTDLADDNAA